MAQVWAIVSDAALIASVVYGILQLLTSAPWDTHILAVVGFIVIGCAAFVGLARFWLPEPSCSLLKIHRSLVWLGVTAGLTLIAAQMFHEQGQEEVSRMFIALGILVLVVKILSDYRTSMSLSEFAVAVSVCSILVISVLKPSMFGCLGAVVLIVTGLMVATRGRRLGMPAVDMFHYGLSLAILAFTRALQQNASDNNPEAADDA